ncbi:MAG: MFS transporter, partial [Planctomycetaceae bacterium]|nr:MFS transporter [Planctomycetaceae bacterium]
GGWSLAGIATGLAGQKWITSLLESPSDEPGTGVYHWLLICRVILGVFEAGHWPCALLTVRAILSEKDRTLGNGILQSGASIGAVIVPFYVQFGEWAGQSWDFPFWSIGTVGLLWIPAWFVLVSGRDLSTPKTEAPPETKLAKTPQQTSEDFSNLIRRLIVLAVMVASLTISWQFLRAWLALFLQDHHKYSKELTR